MTNKRKIFIKYLVSMFALILCVIGLAACKKDNNPEFYSVSFVVDGELYHSDTIPWEQSVTFPDEPTKQGYNFDGWYDGNTKITEIKHGFKEKLTLTAKWDIINHTITYNLDGGTNNIENPSTFNIESPTIILAQPEKAGYKFLGWYNGDVKITEIPNGYNKDIVLTASWEIDIESTCFLINTQDGYIITGLKDEIPDPNITIPDYVTAIEASAFEFSEIVTVDFGENSQCEYIGDNAFLYCSLLESVKIPASLKSIGNTAFYMCSSLKEIYFEEGTTLETIGEGAFNDCYALKTFEIPATVTSLGDAIFGGCKNLESLTFQEGSNIKVISNFLFANLEVLKSLVIPASVTSIGDGAFMNCPKLESITFEEGSLIQTVGDNAFSSCNALKSVEIPVSVTSIGTSSNYTLNEVYYGGSESELNSVAGLNNLLSSGATIYYYSQNNPESDGNYWHRVQGIITKW